MDKLNNGQGAPEPIEENIEEPAGDQGGEGGEENLDEGQGEAFGEGYAGQAVEGEGEEARGRAAAPAAPEEPPYVLELREKLAAMEEKLGARAEAQSPKEPEPTKLTEEWFKENEKHWGFQTVKDEETGKDVTTFNQRTFLTEQMNFGRWVLAEARKYADQVVHGNVSDIRFEAALADLERKHPDIRQHATNIKDYLKKRYQPKDMSNPEFMIDGYRWSKGGASPARSGQPPKRNAKVSLAPANRSGRPGDFKQAPLGPIARRQIASGEFKDEAEYRAWQRSNMAKV